tara:strand:+ start:81 stop:389 length:309 start_codon:yes stop_codon:yes gene_type:complete
MQKRKGESKREEPLSLPETFFLQITGRKAINIKEKAAPPMKNRYSKLGNPKKLRINEITRRRHKGEKKSKRTLLLNLSILKNTKIKRKRKIKLSLYKYRKRP